MTQSGNQRNYRIDAHHHLWRYTPAEFSWIPDTMAPLRKDFLPPAFEAEMKLAKIDGAVTVQATRTVEETTWLLECATASRHIWGVVGWVPMDGTVCGTWLDRWAQHRALVGVREIAQGQPAGFFEGAGLNRALEEITQRGLTYDLLIFRDQLPEAQRFVDRHPKQVFVLDHAAKPAIAAGELEPWRQHVKELGKRSHVSCKISGLATEADWMGWKMDDLRPYLDALVEAFGVDRLLAGSDWPVCLMATGYDRWWEALGSYFSSFSPAEQDAVFGRNAQRVYSLQLPASL